MGNTTPFKNRNKPFVNCKEDDRICELCNIEIENEQHFIYTYTSIHLYNEERNSMYKNVNMSNFKLQHAVSDICCQVTSYPGVL